MTQPGHSLYGAGAANPFNPNCLLKPSDKDKGPKVCGSPPLYKGKTRIGGLGASGDTACADHEIAKRMRDKLGMNPEGGALVHIAKYLPIGEGPAKNVVEELEGVADLVMPGWRECTVMRSAILA